MNEATYALCVEQMLIPSYPDIDTGENTVCLVDDGGPGRNSKRNQRMMKKAGVDNFPKLQNTSAFTQECDQLFGLL
jgi:hypothetical protein